MSEFASRRASRREVERAFAWRAASLRSLWDRDMVSFGWRDPTTKTQHGAISLDVPPLGWARTLMRLRRAQHARQA